MNLGFFFEKIGIQPLLSNFLPCIQQICPAFFFLRKLNKIKPLCLKKGQQLPAFMHFLSFFWAYSTIGHFDFWATHRKRCRKPTSVDNYGKNNYGRFEFGFFLQKFLSIVIFICPLHFFLAQKSLNGHQESLHRSSKKGRSCFCPGFGPKIQNVYTKRKVQAMLKSGTGMIPSPVMVINNWLSGCATADPLVESKCMHCKLICLNQNSPSLFGTPKFRISASLAFRVSKAD